MPDMEKKTGGFRESWDLTAQTLRPQEKQPGRVSPKEYPARLFCVQLNSSELSTKVAALGLERCCLYPGEMLKAAECLRAGDSAKEIQAKIESGEFQCPDLFHTSLPKNPSRETCEMSNQEFIAHINTLIPAPNKEINGNLLDFGNSLWFELKEDLYNAFTFISRHFTPETLQSVYDLSGAMDQGSIIKDD